MPDQLLREILWRSDFVGAKPSPVLGGTRLKSGHCTDLDWRRRLWRWSIFLLRRREFEEQLATVGGHQSAVGQGSDHGLSVPDVRAVGGGAVAIVLAEVEAAAPHVLISFEGSFAASSSVRHWAGLKPDHGKTHVWCCVSPPISFQRS